MEYQELWAPDWRVVAKLPGAFLIKSPIGSMTWIVDGRPHRTDGPAFIDEFGKEIYYLDGEAMTKEQWDLDVESWIKEDIKDMVI